MSRKPFFLSLSILIFIVLIIVYIYSLSSRRNRIKTENGKTIITVELNGFPTKRNKLKLILLESFRQDFPIIFAKKYRDKYKASPEKYGKYNWDNVEINIKPYSGINKRRFNPRLDTNTPDIVFVNLRTSFNYIQGGYLYPLDKYYNTLTSEQIDEYVNPKFKLFCYNKGPNDKQHWWTMPFGGTVSRVIIFRKDVFDKHKIPYPDKNWTWKDFMRICKKITDSNKKHYGIRLKSCQASWYWIPFLLSAGARVTTYDKKTDRWKYVFDSDAAVKALDFYTQLSTELWIDKNHKKRYGYAYKDYKEADEKWKRGDIAMSFTYLEEVLLMQNNPKNVGFVPVPLGPTGIRSSEINTRMYGLSAKIRAQAVRDAAWEYILYMNSVKAKKIQTDFLVKTGKGRLVNPVYLKRFGYNSLVKQVDKKLVESYNISNITGIPEPYQTILSDYIYNEMTVAIQRAEELAWNAELAPIGSKKRYHQLKKILVEICTRANKLNNKLNQK